MHLPPPRLAPRKRNPFPFLLILARDGSESMHNDHETGSGDARRARAGELGLPLARAGSERSYRQRARGKRKDYRRRARGKKISLAL